MSLGQLQHLPLLTQGQGRDPAPADHDKNRPLGRGGALERLYSPFYPAPDTAARAGGEIVLVLDREGEPVPGLRVGFRSQLG